MAKTSATQSMELQTHGSDISPSEPRDSESNLAHHNASAAQDQESHNDIPRPEHEFSLPPVDRGKDAWLFLAACFMLEGTIWGFPSVYGIFQDYYSTHEKFADSTSLPVVGTCAMGTMYIGLPVAFVVLKSFPRMIRWANAIGLLVACLSLAMASFAQNVGQLIATQGILFAVGGVFAWTPILFYINEWFAQRLSMAYGVLMVGMPARVI